MLWLKACYGNYLVRLTIRVDTDHPEHVGGRECCLIASGFLTVDP